MPVPPPSAIPTGVVIRGSMRPEYASILTYEALDFVSTLVRAHRGHLATLLQLRKDAQARFDRGSLPGFLKSTAAIRDAAWQVAPQPADIQDRRVEITGPVDRKMVINALNSGARVFMADFEDSNAPTWDNIIQGQINLRDAVAGTITLEAPGKTYRLNATTAVLFVRPRGLHLPEAHIEVLGEAAPGCLVDFGLYLFHNARALLAKGSGPYFYLPKLENHLEAKWWNEVFVHAQRLLGLPVGTIKATVLIETLPASFQVEEILWQLKEHSAGLNCGRWDYIFSYIKTVRAHPEFVLPDRSEVGMTQPMMRAYAQRVVQICHKRGAPAMGGMAAQIPIKDDPAANEAALAKVRADKLREVQDGHDGTWVAHPALVPIAMEIFDAHMKGKNQIDRQRPEVEVSEADLLRVPKGARTWAGLCHNLRVGVQYMEAWLRGLGCVPLYNLMEDAATAEISRAQVWQWVRHQAALDDGRTVTRELFEEAWAQELHALRASVSHDPVRAEKLELAARLFHDMIVADELAPFLTSVAYEHLIP